MFSLVVYAYIQAKVATTGPKVIHAGQCEELNKERDLIKQSFILNQCQYPDLLKTMSSGR
ncbi:hypothetical protein NC653_003024 [Populus alba x Populus x berolinensis]|uniref:Uncharacterized protein n=1 Tax=Populus alba x Populus x berolinensis TaxID=444605 RepID=A0AAD6RR42_9ROSI|nr:hypothetical protein NC653_003024 [Populus alba x Populus x berolinensis]